MAAAPFAPVDEVRLTRRERIGALTAALAVYLFTAEATASVPKVRRLAPRLWVERQEQIARAFKAGEITPLAWMTDLERLAREVDTAELMRYVRAARLTSAGAGAGHDPKKHFVQFLGNDGRPRRLTFGAALFDFAPGAVITPHGHRHMASAHLVVDGGFRIRNFDRIGDEPGRMLIRPTRDYLAEIGHLSTMTSARDNIHWFVPRGAHAATFDLILSGLDAGMADYEIEAIDPLAADRRPGGVLAAPVIPFEQASRKYTSDV